MQDKVTLLLMYEPCVRFSAINMYLLILLVCLLFTYWPSFGFWHTSTFVETLNKGIYSAFRKCSDPFYFHFVYLSCSLILQLFQFFFFSLIYTYYPLIENEIRILEMSDPLLCTLLKHLWQQLHPFWVWWNKLCTHGLGHFMPIFANPKGQSRWMGTKGRQPQSGLS